MLKIGVQTKGILPEMDVHKGFEMIHQVGFEKIDFNLDTFLKNSDIYAGKINSFFDNDMEELIKYFLPYREAMEECGISPSQMHAPYPVYVDGRGKQNDYMMGSVIPKSLIIAEALQVPWVIVHPFKLQYMYGREYERQINLAYFKALIPMMKEGSAKICFENLYEGQGGRIVEGVCADPDDAIWYIDTLNEIAGEELFGFCLDTGHLQLTKRNPYEFIKRMGSRLKCLHMHENDSWEDLHQMPYTSGSTKDEGVDWDGIIKGLKEINFQGTLSFETFPCMNSFPRSISSTVLETIHSIGSYFSEQIGETSEQKKIHLGIIGTGRIAKRFVQDARAVDNVEVNCSFNPNPESAKRFAKENKISQYTSQLDKMQNVVAAVYIASPHDTHYKYAKEMLLAGKHVLCEKPMALKKAEAEELYTLARQKGLILMEAVKTACCPGFIAMMDMVKSGKIGNVSDVEACFSRLTPTNLRELTDLQYGGSFTELGSYVLLPILKLLGTEYKNVEFHSITAKNGLDLYTKVSLDYENGMALGKAGLGVKSEGQLVIAGTKGYILAESPWWLTKKFEVRFENANRREVYTFPYEGSGLQYELSAFAKEITNVQNGIVQERTEGVLARESIAAADILEQFLQNRNLHSDHEKERKVKIWAHRGCSMLYPENTLQSFEAAAKLNGVAGIELDVQLTSDGEIVVTHDENVSRVTNGTKNVVEYSLAELKELKIDAGDGKTACIPTLREVLELMKPYCIEKGIKINIELKTSIIHYQGIEEMTLNMVKEFGLQDYIVYSSFWAESVKLIKELDPKAKTGMLAENLEDCIKWGEYAGVDALHPWIGGLNGNVPTKMQNLPIRAWNGEEPFFRDGRVLKEKNLPKYAMFGVTEVFTNVPEIYLD